MAILKSSWRRILLSVCLCTTFFSFANIYRSHTTVEIPDVKTVSYSQIITTSGEQNVLLESETYTGTGNVLEDPICNPGNEGFSMRATLDLPLPQGERYFFQRGSSAGFRIGTKMWKGQEILRISHFGANDVIINLDIGISPRNITMQSTEIKVVISIDEKSRIWSAQGTLDGKKFRATRPLLSWSCEVVFFGTSQTIQQVWEGDLEVYYGPLGDSHETSALPRIIRVNLFLIFVALVLVISGLEPRTKVCPKNREQDIL